MAAYLGGDVGEAVSAQTSLSSKLVVTGLRCDRSLTDVSAPIPAEKAFIVSVHLTDIPFHELRLRGAVVHTGRHPKGGVSVFDLEDDPRFFFASSFHCLHFYVRRTTLDVLVAEQGARRIDTLSWPHGAIDETVSHLGYALLPALNNPDSAGKLFLDHVALALNMHYAYAYGGMRSAARMARGGLAPWQERRCKELMNSRIRRLWTILRVCLTTVRQLAQYWLHDRRKVEARLDALPQFITEIDGHAIHFVHVRSRRQSASPMIVTHGWPSCRFCAWRAVTRTLTTLEAEIASKLVNLLPASIWPHD